MNRDYIEKQLETLDKVITVMDVLSHCRIDNGTVKLTPETLLGIRCEIDMAVDNIRGEIKKSSSE